MSQEDQFVPHLIVSDGMAALKFYQEVLSARTRPHHDGAGR